jgi:hypothetical protein
VSGPYRRYRPARLGRTLRTFDVIWLLLFVGIAFGNAYDGEYVVVTTVLLGLTWVAMVVAFEWAIKHVGLEERPDGFMDVVLGIPLRRFTPFEDIVRFETRPGRNVVMILHNEFIRPVQGVRQRRRMAWDGGETRDIVAVLNERIGATGDRG